jgi:hypothetical protein
MVHSNKIHYHQVTKTNCNRSSRLPQKGSLFLFHDLAGTPNHKAIRRMCFHVWENVEVLNLVVYPVKESLKAFTTLIPIQ